MTRDPPRLDHAAALGGARRDSRFAVCASRRRLPRGVPGLAARPCLGGRSAMAYPGFATRSASPGNPLNNDVSTTRRFRPGGGGVSRCPARQNRALVYFRPCVTAYPALRSPGGRMIRKAADVLARRPDPVAGRRPTRYRPATRGRRAQNRPGRVGAVRVGSGSAKGGGKTAAVKLASRFFGKNSVGQSSSATGPTARRPIRGCPPDIR